VSWARGRGWRFSGVVRGVACARGGKMVAG